MLKIVDIIPTTEGDFAVRFRTTPPGCIPHPVFDFTPRVATLEAARAWARDRGAQVVLEQREPQRVVDTETPTGRMVLAWAAAAKTR